MTTLIDTVKPTESYLNTLLPQALNGLDEDCYVEKCLSGLIDVLTANPKMYRVYGPWWPALKTLLLTRGEVSLGQIVDSDVAEIYKMSRPALTLLSAYLYSGERVENDAVFNPVHVLEVAGYSDDTEPYIYTSYDESIERFRLRVDDAKK